MNTNKRTLKKIPSRNSIIALFSAGALLLILPLAFVLGVGNEPCNQSSSCLLSQTYREVVAALPYIMITGGVLIAYNLKRISDSLLPLDTDQELSGEQETF